MLLSRSPAHSFSLSRTLSLSLSLSLTHSHTQSLSILIVIIVVIVIVIVVVIVIIVVVVVGGRDADEPILVTDPNAEEEQIQVNQLSLYMDLRAEETTEKMPAAETTKNVLGVHVAGGEQAVSLNMVRALAQHQLPKRRAELAQLFAKRKLLLRPE